MKMKEPRIQKGVNTANSAKIQEGHRQIIVDFEGYVKKKKQGLIEKYSLDELMDVFNEHQVEHGYMDWFKEIEKRIKVLKRKNKK